MLEHAIRESEMLKEKEAYRILQKPSTQMGVGIRSIAHGAVYPNHRRDLRTLRLLILEVVLADVKAERAALEVGGNGGCAVHLYSKEGETDTQTISIVAYRGHMRFARQTEYAAPKKWKNWKVALTPMHVSAVLPWEGVMRSSSEICDHLPMVACRGCKVEIKTCLSQAAVGTLGEKKEDSAPTPFTLDDSQSYNRSRDNPGHLHTRSNTPRMPASPNGSQTPSDGTAGTPSAWNEAHDRPPSDLAKLGENALRMDCALFRPVDSRSVEKSGVSTMSTHWLPNTRNVRTGNIVWNAWERS